MTFGRPFKEVYIHLVENEPMFVCTIRYGGFPGKSTEFPLKIRPEVSPAIEGEAPAVIRTRNRFGASPQGGTGKQ
jgi:hypothetical protein